MTRTKWDAIKNAILSLRQNASDDTALECSAIYPEWDSDKHYSVGERVLYGGTLYKCIQPHLSIASWNPADAPSLWAEVLNETVSEWRQPDSTNAYMTGDKVKHNGKTWRSFIDNNVWEPGIYGWEAIL